MRGAFLHQEAAKTSLGLPASLSVSKLRVAPGSAVPHASRQHSRKALPPSPTGVLHDDTFAIAARFLTPATLNP
jgi:hypothetical protein